MEPTQALALGVIIVLIVLLIAAYYWYHWIGWVKFNFVGIVPYGTEKNCKKHSDCSLKEKCVGDTCITPCSTDSDCLLGRKCTGGNCGVSTIPSWTAPNNGNVTKLRFKGCIFTIVDPRGKKHVVDVTTILNGMAVAYRGAIAAIPRTLYLDRPLNAFSFTINGVNDSLTVKTAVDAQKWANCATTLTGTWRSI